MKTYAIVEMMHQTKTPPYTNNPEANRIYLKS